MSLDIKIDDIHDIHKGFNLTLNPGFTALVGPNGAGKTTLLGQIKDFAVQNQIPVWKYSNAYEGRLANDKYALAGKMELVATIMVSSEGEQVAINFGQAVSELGRFVTKTKGTIIILLDAIDSGASIDRARDIRDLFEMILENEKGRDVYIIMAVNHYELAKAPVDCVNVRTGERLTFDSYDSYADFICNFLPKR